MNKLGVHVRNTELVTNSKIDAKDRGSNNVAIATALVSQ